MGPGRHSLPAEQVQVHSFEGIEGVQIAEESNMMGGLLTPRETRLLTLLANGLSRKEIAEELHVALVTVKRSLEHIRVKLDADTTAQAVASAIRRGIIP